MEISFVDSDSIVLTPAQEAFVCEHRPDFTSDTYCVTLAGYAGSDRRFYRIAPKSIPLQSVILMVWQSTDPDWQRFLDIPTEIGKAADYLPAIIASDDRHGLILEEDLGEMTLRKYCIVNASSSDLVESAYIRVVDALIDWQKIDVEHAPTLSSRAMDEEMFIWESDYFALHCVSEFYGYDKGLSGEWHKERLALAHAAASLPYVAIHRDFQSENILLDNGNVRFVDYQGARRGPCGYDLASLILDPYCDHLVPTVCAKLLAYYQSVNSSEMSVHNFHVCAAQRLMQALGAYANLSIHKGKDRYRQFLPIALKRLHSILVSMEGVSHLTMVVAGCIEKSAGEKGV